MLIVVHKCECTQAYSAINTAQSRVMTTHCSPSLSGHPKQCVQGAEMRERRAANKGRRNVPRAHTSLLNQMEIIVLPLPGRQADCGQWTGQSRACHARRSCPLCWTHSIAGQFRFRQSPVALIKVLMHPTDCSESPSTLPSPSLLRLLGDFFIMSRIC